ncbi:MAG TPA: DUF6510 family protein, partial [Pseudonocardiaceae bacterium]|nr:DUF6510 family protein [Pseudonocardiaceae bacterium]
PRPDQDRTFRSYRRPMMTNPDEVADRRLDANAAAGPLAELFTVDLTTAVATCAGCGNSAPLAAHLLYADGPAADGHRRA